MWTLINDRPMESSEFIEEIFNDINKRKSKINI
jgi:hypothetical protein